jgi:hypothetical protein
MSHPQSLSSPLPMSVNNNNAQKTFLRKHYSGANPLGVLNSNSLGGDFLAQFAGDKNLVHGIVQTVTGTNFDEAGATQTVTNDLADKYANDSEFKDSIDSAIASNMNNPKTLKSKFSSVINQSIKEGGLPAMKTVVEGLKLLRQKRKNVSDPFQKAALSFRIKQIDSSILAAKKALLTIAGVDANTLYAKAAQQKSGVIWSEMPDDFNLKPIEALYGDWEDYMDKKDDAATVGGRLIPAKWQAKADRIKTVLNAPGTARSNKELMIASQYVPRKSRITSAEEWSDTLHPGYVDYEPRGLYGSLMGPEYAASRFLKYQDVDGKFRQLPRAALKRYEPYGFEDSDGALVQVKRKSIKDSIKSLAAAMIGDVADVLRVEPELLVVLSEFLDAYGRKLIEGLIMTYVALEGGVQKPSLKIGLSHLAALFRSPKGQQLVQQYGLGNLNEAVSVGLEDVDTWIEQVTPWYSPDGDVKPWVDQYDTRVKVPKRKPIQERIPDHGKLLTFLDNKKGISLLQKYEGLTDARKGIFSKMTNRDFALNMGRKQWVKKRANIQEVFDNKIQKTMAQYNLSQKEATDIVKRDPVILHFFKFGNWSAVMNDLNPMYGDPSHFAAKRDENKAILAEFGNLDLSGFKDRKSEHGLLRAVYRQRNIQGSLLNQTTATQWFAVVISAGSDGDSKNRIKQSIANYMQLNLDQVTTLLDAHALAYLKGVNRLVLGANYTGVYNWVSEVSNIWDSTPPPEAATILAIPGVIEFAIQMCILRMLDILRFGSVEEEIPALSSPEQIRQLNRYVSDKISATEVFRAAHSNISADVGRFENLFKVSNKEYDLAVRTVIRASNRDSKALELFGTNVMKVPFISKMCAVLLGLSNTVTSLFAMGPGWVVLVDQITAKLLSQITGKQQSNSKIAEHVTQQLVFTKGSGLNTFMRKYQQYDQSDVGYLRTKQDRAALKSERNLRNLKVQEFLQKNNNLGGLTGYSRFGSNALTPAQQAAISAANASAVNLPDADMEMEEDLAGGGGQVLKGFGKRLGAPSAPVAQVQAAVSNIQAAAAKKISKKMATGAPMQTRAKSRINMQALGSAEA